MRISKPAKWILATITALILTVIYLPLAVVFINSFNTSINMDWPPPSFTFMWWERAAQSTGLIDALITSLIVAAAATVIALVLGTLLAMALSRL